jgi:hypothetical protein
MLKNPGIPRKREGHEFHSCRQAHPINSGFQPLRESVRRKHFSQTLQTHPKQDTGVADVRTVDNPDIAPK